jgi:hypothetical protein
VPNTQLAKLRSTQTVPTATRTDLPRPAIIAALGILVLAITFLVTKPGDDVGSVAAPAPPASTTTGTTSTSATGTDTTTSTSTGTSATPAPAKPKQPAVEAGPGMPRDVAQALNANKVVVLFFYEPAASDDQATRAAVRAVRSAGGGAGQVRLFQDVVARISDYRRVTGSLGISQSPAMVVIDRNRKAQLLQGYLDSGSIRQTVRDAS